MNNPLVSVIIPTRNCCENLKRSLEKISKQTYQNIEIIIVDGNSIDNTKGIAGQYTDKVFNFEKLGDQRSAQRNLGVGKAQGEYILIIDSDMELSDNVVLSCVEKMEGDKNIAGIIIPEESFGEGFWAQCKKLEKSFYMGVDWIEAARFFRRLDFLTVGGYNENMISGEDWDLSQRIEYIGKIDRIDDFIRHNEGKINLIETVGKKFYYAGKILKYKENNSNQEKIVKQTGIINRYKLFLSQPKKLFKNPIVGFGMIFMKICEFGFGGVGYFLGKIKKI